MASMIIMMTKKAMSTWRISTTHNINFSKDIKYKFLGLTLTSATITHSHYTLSLITTIDALRHF